MFAHTRRLSFGLVAALCAFPADAQDSFITEDTTVAPDPPAAVVPVEPGDTPPERTPPRRFRRDGYSGLGIGLRLGYFHYDEILPEGEVLRLLEADSLDGTPKSTEHGLLEGLEVNCRLRIPKTPLFGRAYGGAYLGLLNKYDGSTQAELNPSDSVHYVDPLEFRKTNSFFRIGLEAGAGYFGKGGAALLFVGIDGRLWNRSFPGVEVEKYYWTNLVFGLELLRSTPRNWQLGAVSRLYFMVKGAMQYEAERRGIAGAPLVDAPAVELSHYVPFWRRTSFRLEFPARKRFTDRLSLRMYPWFEYYHFGKSETQVMTNLTDATQATFLEPASDTYRWGLNLDVLLHFRGRARRR